MDNVRRRSEELLPSYSSLRSQPRNNYFLSGGNIISIYNVGSVGLVSQRSVNIFGIPHKILYDLGQLQGIRTLFSTFFCEVFYFNGGGGSTERAKGLAPTSPPFLRACSWPFILRPGKLRRSRCSIFIDVWKMSRKYWIGERISSIHNKLKNKWLYFFLWALSRTI